MRNRKPPPSLILLADERVQAGYADFIESRNPLARTQYGSTARRFFGWAENQGLTLNTIERSHVAAFYKDLLDHHGHAVAYGSSRVILNLFAHLNDCGVLAVNPADGLSIRSARCAKRLRAAIEADYGNEDQDLIDAILVMISPMQIMTLSLQAISRYTYLLLEFVERIAGRLYDQGIWGKDESIRGEWLDDHEDPAHGYISLLLDGCVALGQFDRNVELGYSLPAGDEQPEASTGKSASMKTTIRETKETVTREITQEIVVTW